ncbi:hypothetical protein TrCOL_g12024 [Triparma columacea]|uniref:Uncharacterized protein n=1 Tax=Triparma columacea TaxID=722753 RepID=A0A9W7FZH5_9STRA|nr:hypothetical protein TrCOL_g12024 [Triparma columacea]
MKLLTFLFALLTLAPATAFFGVSTPTSAFSSTSLSAKHAMKKAAKGHNAYRPKKSRPSDINRKAPSYNLPKDADKPAEYTIGGK